MMLEFGIFFLIGALFVVGSFAASFFLSPHHPSEKKLSPYECGEEPVAGSWIQYNVRYYLIGLAFVIFDVEVVFLAPCLLALKPLGLPAFFEITAFLAILILGLVYAWRKGALEWT